MKLWGARIMITISEDKISANQFLKSNNSTKDSQVRNVSITLSPGDTTGNYPNSFISKDSFVDEITFNIAIKT